MDAIADIGGVGATASGIIAGYAVYLAAYYTLGLASIIKRRAEQRIRHMRIKRIQEKLPQIEAGIKKRMETDQSESLKTDLELIGSVADMDQFTYKDAEAKLEELVRLQEAYLDADAEEEDPDGWEQARNEERATKTERFTEISNTKAIDIADQIRERISYMRLFEVWDGLEMSTIKRRKIKG